ncbi:hypothetical protein [Wolbachia endosymbiont of Mansonella ozzardi]|nr:hypothetical protein [Wolbachia endosymbiont of Mansonella ozzardi]
MIREVSGMTGRGHWNNRRKETLEMTATFMTPFVVRITLAR